MVGSCRNRSQLVLTADLRSFCGIGAQIGSPSMLTSSAGPLLKKIAGEQCPEGWLIDSQGRATTNPNDLYGDPPGAILPMGGAQAYKGFGLGVMVEILTGALSGGECAREVPYPKKGNCVFMLLLDPARFGGADHFAAQVKQLADYIRSCPRAEGCERIMLPGDPERVVSAKRRAEGIFLDRP